MARGDYLPSRDTALLVYSTNYSSIVTLDPVVLGLQLSDATALAALVTAYSGALSTATNHSTRTPASITAKNTCRAQLIADIRSVTRRIQATPSVTAEQKSALGITVPSHTRSPVPPPSTKPVLSIAAVGSRTITVRLADETTPTKRAKPAGVEAAQIITAVVEGATPPPADLTLWQTAGIATRNEFEVDYPVDAIGKTAYVRALWIGTKGEEGPVSDEVFKAIAA